MSFLGMFDQKQQKPISQNPVAVAAVKKTTPNQPKAVESPIVWGPVQSAFVYYFKLHKTQNRKWEIGTVNVQIATTPFAAGAFRTAFKAQVHTPSRPSFCVLKEAKLPVPPESYFLDCATQMYSKWFAERYNELKPPKPLMFIDSFVIHVTPLAATTLSSTTTTTTSSSTTVASSSPPMKPKIDPLPLDNSSVLFAGEIFVEGQYVKHSDNFGWTNNEISRGTPHAFSHFAYEASNRTLVIVDLQGVNDFYTDPQIHTLDRNLFGDGNLGFSGLWAFVSTHECNSVCASIGLLPLEKPWLETNVSKSPTNNIPQQQQQQQITKSQALQKAAMARKNRIQTEVFSVNETELLQKQRQIETLARNFEILPLPEQVPPTIQISPTRREIIIEQPDDLPAGCELKWGAEVSKFYFVNHLEKKSSWEDPRGPGASLPPIPVTKGRTLTTSQKLKALFKFDKEKDNDKTGKDSNKKDVIMDDVK